jgi:hypothetical protein
VQDSFNPKNVAALAHHLDIPPSLMFMSCPGPNSGILSPVLARASYPFHNSKAAISNSSCITEVFKHLQPFNHIAANDHLGNTEIQNMRIRKNLLLPLRAIIHNRHSYTAAFGSSFSAAAVELASAAYLRSSIPNATLRIVGWKDAIVKPKGSLILDSHPSGRRSSMRMDSRSEARPPNIVKKIEALHKKVEVIDRGREGE